MDMKLLLSLLLPLLLTIASDAVSKFDRRNAFWQRKRLHIGGASAAMKNRLIESSPPSALATSSSAPAKCPPSNYNGNSGSISSPNYPGLYPNNAYCIYVIQVPSGHVVLQFTSFMTEASYDFVSIYDDSKVDNPEALLAHISGNYLQSNSGLFYSGGSYISLLFTSDSSTQMMGFSAKWTAAAKICGGAFSNSSGTFTSPNYPNNYPSYLDCVWDITVPVGRIVQLSFVSDSITEPQYDVVTVYDGINGTEIAQYGDVSIRKCPVDERQSVMSSVFRFSGQDFQTVESTGNIMRVIFTSDASLSYSGFSATYTTVSGSSCSCGQSVLSVGAQGFGNLSSPNYPQPYCNNQNCTWYLNVPANRGVQLHFQYFDTEPGYDFVTLFEGNGVNGKFIVSCTGTACSGKKYTSKSNSMTVIFVSDYTGASQGFTGVFYAVSV